MEGGIQKVGRRDQKVGWRDQKVGRRDKKGLQGGIKKLEGGTRKDGKEDQKKEKRRETYTANENPRKLEGEVNMYTEASKDITPTLFLILPLASSTPLRPLSPLTLSPLTLSSLFFSVPNLSLSLSLSVSSLSAFTPRWRGVDLFHPPKSASASKPMSRRPGFFR